jgi:hypothetical protein
VAANRTPYELLERAGLIEIHVVDQTADFRTVAAAWIEQWDRHRDALVELYGPTDFETRQQERHTQLKAVDDGLLQRSLAVGRRPISRRSSRN